MRSLKVVAHAANWCWEASDAAQMDAPVFVKGRKRKHVDCVESRPYRSFVSPAQCLEQVGVSIDDMSNHTVSQSLYLDDPDGNEVELYIDADPALWKNNPAAVLSTIKPLRL